MEAKIDEKIATLLLLKIKSCKILVMIKGKTIDILKALCYCKENRQKVRRLDQWREEKRT